MHCVGGLSGLNLVISLYLALTPCFAQQQCYYPAGNTAPDIPCNTTATFSACCNQNAFCMGNGLCYSNAVISRGSCTDKSFKDPACATYCTQWQTNAGSVLVNCNASSDAFICAGQSCSDQNSLFTMRDANTFLFNTSGDSLLEVSPRDVIALSSSNTSQSSGNATSPASSTSNPSASSSASSSDKYTAGDMAGVGVGIGVPLLLALLGALYVIRKQSKRLEAMNAQARSEPVVSAQAPTPAPAYSKAVASGYGSPQVYAHDPLLPSHPMVVGGTTPHYHSEMDAGMGINELGNVPERQELDTTK